MKFFHRIRYKLLFAFTLVALIPSAIVGYYSIDFSTRSLVDQAFAGQHQVVAGKEQNIANFLASTAGDVQFLAASAPLKALLRARKEATGGDPAQATRQALEQEFLAFAAHRRIYYQIRYLDENGVEIVRVDTDNQGKSAVIPSELLQDQSGRYYFKETVNLPEGQLFVSPLDLNRERGKVEVPYKPVIRYGVSVRYPDGSKAGIVITNVDASRFLSTLGEVQLVDAEGYYLAHPETGKRWGSERDLGHHASLKLDHPEKAELMLRQTDGSLTTAEQAIYFQHLRVPGASTEWALVSSQPLAALLEGVSSFRRTFFVILGLALGAALAFAFVLDAKITRPIEQLTASAEKVSMGDLMGEVRVADQGEIGQLAAAFERMRISLIRLMERKRKV